MVVAVGRVEDGCGEGGLSKVVVDIDSFGRGFGRDADSMGMVTFILMYLIGRVVRTMVVVAED